VRAARYLVLAAAIATGGCAAHASPRNAPAAASSTAAPAKAVRGLQADLARVFGAPIMARGVWGVDVRSLDTGDTLYSLNADKLMMPASNMKIVTMAAAAETLGWDHRFTTTLETAGRIDDGVLRGDLFVRSSGDPSINARGNRAATVLDEWAAALRAAGVTSIDGRVIGDDQFFDDDGLGPGWSWDYLQYGYAAPVGALEFNENVAVLTVSPGAAEGQPAVVTLPPGTGFILVNRATTSAAGTPESIDYRRYMDRPVLEVTGTIPLPSGTPGRTVSRTVAVLNPTLYFAQSLKDGLAARGIPVSGHAFDIDDVAAELQGTGAGERRVLVTSQSPPLSEIGTVLMKVSQNLYAEAFLKTIGAAKGGLGTFESGRRAVRELLTGWGIPPDGHVLSDGSGLSRYNYVTARTITAILERMHKDDRHREAFAATLPIAGKDGTIATRLRRTRAEGNAIAKTGSIANVRSLSGYVRTRDGERLVFSILSNDFVIPAATVTYIADVAVEVLANFTRH
jgi:D-alanyl-D-alanine carboxypeptidase/D-alanyl-D-alanine-endopeptidase (penicillin-binding protein 4)